LGELLEFDFETMSSMRLYRASDQLIRNRELIEQGLFSRIDDMFSLETTVVARKEKGLGQLSLSP